MTLGCPGDRLAAMQRNWFRRLERLTQALQRAGGNADARLSRVESDGPAKRVLVVAGADSGAGDPGRPDPRHAIGRGNQETLPGSPR